MTHDEICKLAIETAEKSPCKKRKVGAVIVGASGKVLSTGWNNRVIGLASPSISNSNCEDANGNTLPDIAHAEIMAIDTITKAPFEPKEEPTKIYVTYQPCDNCQAAIDKAGLQLVLVENFMKFDSGKLRYSLVPPVAIEAMAKVLTYGAKKYKPNNWQKADDFDRYTDALYRHLEAWRNGQEFDEESGLSHLSHALTNIAFLIWYDANRVRVDGRVGSNID